MQTRSLTDITVFTPLYHTAPHDELCETEDTWYWRLRTSQPSMAVQCHFPDWAAVILLCFPGKSSGHQRTKPLALQSLVFQFGVYFTLFAYFIPTKVLSGFQQAGYFHWKFELSCCHRCNLRIRSHDSCNKSPLLAASQSCLQHSNGCSLIKYTHQCTANKRNWTEQKASPTYFPIATDTLGQS